MQPINNDEYSFKLLSVKKMIDINELDLTTPEEKEFHKDYMKKLRLFGEGKVSGIEIRQYTAAASTIAKKQQSRSSVMAMNLTVSNMLNRIQVEKNENEAIQQEIEDHTIN